jgi:hypothetical protein
MSATLAEVYSTPGPVILLRAVVGRSAAVSLVAYALILRVNALFLLRQGADGGESQNEDKRDYSFHFLPPLIQPNTLRQLPTSNTGRLSSEHKSKAGAIQAV